MIRLLLLATTMAAMAQQQQDNKDDTSSILLWSSTGGGWRAMFADIGYANAFQQAGLFTENSTRLSGVATVSGASWFSTQLFFSEAFYNQTVLAETPEQVENFVLRWMETYLNIKFSCCELLTGRDDEEIKEECDTSDWRDSPLYDPDRDFASIWQDICALIHKYDFDWALFIQAMLDAAATDYGDSSFVDTVASPENRISPLRQTDLLVLAALVPNSRVRNNASSSADTAVYLGHNNNNNGAEYERLFTTVLSASYVVQESGSGFWYGSEDRTSQIQTYLAKTSTGHSWSDWRAFFLYPGSDGAIEIDNTPSSIDATNNGPLRTPYGGPNATTVIQIAASSSAAAGNGSPLVPSVYTQCLSIGRYRIDENKVRTVWRVLAGIAAGLGAGVFFYFLVARILIKWKSKCCDKGTYRNVGICSGVAGGVGIALVTALIYGFGSILIPTFYDETTRNVYETPDFDNFAVCSQWPNPCGKQDGFFVDGWFIDNPAFVVNVGHHQQKGILTTDKPLKVILTNTNEVWKSTFNYAQILQYFSAPFNQGVAPGEFLWSPGYFAPYRSPQIFEQYLDEVGLDSLLEPIPNSNMTTAHLKGTTLDNPSFGVTEGQTVEILLLNLNEDITTLVVGAKVVEELTQPLAEMTVRIASNQELVRRIRNFADKSND